MICGKDRKNCFAFYIGRIRYKTAIVSSSANDKSQNSQYSADMCRTGFIAYKELCFLNNREQLHNACLSCEINDL